MQLAIVEAAEVAMHRAPVSNRPEPLIDGLWPLVDSADASVRLAALHALAGLDLRIDGLADRFERMWPSASRDERHELAVGLIRCGRTSLLPDPASADFPTLRRMIDACEAVRGGWVTLAGPDDSATYPARIKQELIDSGARATPADVAPLCELASAFHSLRIAFGYLEHGAQPELRLFGARHCGDFINRR